MVIGGSDWWFGWGGLVVGKLSWCEEGVVNFLGEGVFFVLGLVRELMLLCVLI